MKRLASLLSYAITTLLLLMVAGVAMLSVSARLAGDRVPTIGDRKVLNVLSGSMEPAIRTGDVIIVRPLSPGEEPREGDVITFRAVTLEGSHPQMLITHRVVGAILVNGRPTAYITKGDANEGEDLTPVTREAIVGVYGWRVPYFGYITSFTRTPLGIVLMLVIPGLILIAGEVRKVYRVLLADELAKASPK